MAASSKLGWNQCIDFNFAQGHALRAPLHCISQSHNSSTVKFNYTVHIEVIPPKNVILITKEELHQRQIHLLNPYSAGTVFMRQNLTSTDVRFWRIKKVRALQELKYI